MSIEAFFRNEAVLVSKVLLMLETEQEKLTNRLVDDIAKVVEDKSSVLQSLSAATQLRYKALGALGFKPDEDGMRDWVAKCDSEIIKSEWKDFQDVLVRCMEVNRINGLMVSKFILRNQHLLNVLQGKPGNNGMYGANGQMQTT